MTNSKITIHLVPAACGAGKTYGISLFADLQAADGRHVVIVQPTTDLIDETLRVTFPRMGVACQDVEAIHSKNTPSGGVIGRIIQRFKDVAARKNGAITLITQASFFEAPHLHAKDNCILIMDEIPHAMQSIDIALTKHAHMLTDNVTLESIDDGDYSRLFVREDRHALVTQIYEARYTDEVAEVFAPAYGPLLSKDWEVYAKTDSYLKMLARTTKAAEGGVVQSKLIAQAMLTPEGEAFKGWRQIIIMGANADESLLVLLWKHRFDQKVRFKLFEHSSFRLQYDKHPNGGRLDIYYAFDGRWSKAMRNRLVSEGEEENRETVLDRIERAAAGLFGDHPVAVFANKDLEKRPWSFSSPVPIPHVAHGINRFQHLKHGFFVSALNPSPQDFAFLDRIGNIDQVQVQTAIYRGILYQAACRTAIRDLCNTDRIIWVVPDRETAEWLADLFPGCSLHALDVEGITKPKKSKRPCVSGKDRTKKCRDQRAAERERRLARQEAIHEGVAYDNPHLDDANDMRRQIANLEIASVKGINTAKFNGTIFGSKFERSTGGVWAELDSWDRLVELCRANYSIQHASKDDNALISPALFVDNGGDTLRGIAQVACAKHLMLDNDGGDLTVDAFKEIMAGISMVLYSTHSHTAEKPRFRAIIETDERMDVEGYRIVAREIIAKFAAYGYYSKAEIEALARKGPTKAAEMKHHGFDMGKLTPANLMYLPTRGAVPKDAFLEVLGREPVYVCNTLANSRVEPEPEVFQLPIAAVPPPDSGISPSMLVLREAILSQKSGITYAARQQRIATVRAFWDQNAGPRAYNEMVYRTLAQACRIPGIERAEIESVAAYIVSSVPARRQQQTRDEVTRAIARLT